MPSRSAAAIALARLEAASCVAPALVRAWRARSSISVIFNVLIGSSWENERDGTDSKREPKGRQSHKARIPRDFSARGLKGVGNPSRLRGVHRLVPARRSALEKRED